MKLKICYDLYERFGGASETIIDYVEGENELDVMKDVVELVGRDGDNVENFEDFIGVLGSCDGEDYVRYVYDCDKKDFIFEA